MAIYRKKPVEVFAEQYRVGQVHPVGVHHKECPLDHGGPHVHTLEGPLAVSDGDWIITGIKGEQYPCKPDIFEATYQLVRQDE